MCQAPYAREGPLADRLVEVKPLCTSGLSNEVSSVKTVCSSGSLDLEAWSVSGSLDVPTSAFRPWLSESVVNVHPGRKDRVMPHMDPDTLEITDSSLDGLVVTFPSVSKQDAMDLVAQLESSTNPLGNSVSVTGVSLF